MPDQHIYTKVEKAQHLRRLAKRCDEPDKSRFTTMADGYEHETDFVAGSRLAIAESRTLLASVDRLLRPR